jgi:hypothetical protein
MLRSFSLAVCLLTLQSCQTAKLAVSPKQMQLQKQFAETIAFKVKSNRAEPMTSSGMNALSNSGLRPPGSAIGSFDISLNSNHLTINGSKVDVFLPFYGERQMGVGYNDDSGINYKGDIQNLTVKFNEKRKQYSISFSMKNSTESFDVTLELFQNLYTRIKIICSHRSNISYDGYAEALPEATEND